MYQISNRSFNLYAELFFTNLIVIKINGNVNITKRMKFINGRFVSISGLLLHWKELQFSKPLDKNTNMVFHQEAKSRLSCKFRLYRSTTEWK